MAVVAASASASPSRSSSSSHRAARLALSPAVLQPLPPFATDPPSSPPKILGGLTYETDMVARDLRALTREVSPKPHP